MELDSIKSPPLSSATLHILLALVGGNLHGYGIIQEVTRNSGGHYRLGPGTLYDNLRKLMTAGWVTDVPSSAAQQRKSGPAKEDDRRFYALSKKGKDALAIEVARLQNAVREANLRLQEARSVRA
jgi:DNA-binding PadR family transcriptional regulator